MPGAKGILVLEDNDWKECQRVVRSRNRAAGMTRRAQMLLMAAQGFPNRRIALKLGVNAHVVGRVRRDYGERGLAVLSDRHRSGRPRSSRNEQIVRKVVERVCQAPAKGLSRWSVRTPGPAFENAFRHRWPDLKGAEVISASVADFYLQS